MTIIFSRLLRLTKSLVPTLLLLVVGYGISASAQVPPLPTGLSPSDGAQIAATTQVVLSWTAVPGASSYNVRANNLSNSVIRDPQNNCPNSPHYLCVDGVVATSIAMPVDPGSTYGFFLHACNTLGCGDVAAANFAVLIAAPPPQTVPPAPTGLSPAGTTFAAGTANVSLTWNPVGGATWYAVRANDTTDPNARAPGNNCGAVPHYLCVDSGNANSLVVPVTAGHAYYWWVHACNAFGCGDLASNTFSVVSGPPPPPPPPTTGDLISNGGFESPVTSSYVYSPSIPGWTNSGGVAVQRNGSAWAATTAPEGVQTAVLQGVGNLSTTVNAPSPGPYTLSFKAAARTVWGGLQTLNVSVNGAVVYSVTPTSGSFAQFHTTFNLSAGAQTIVFSGMNGGDNSAFIDDVQLTVSGGVGISTYSQLTSDVRVSFTPVTLLSSMIYLPSARWIYVQSDGRFFPEGPAFASAHIEVNGTKISNDSAIDWRGSTRPKQHSFNVIGAAYLGVGAHTITLRGTTVGASVLFGGGTNLSVLATSATLVNNLSLASDSQLLSFNTVGVPEGMAIPNTAFASLLSAQIGNNSGPVIALASGSGFPAAGQYGDAMVGIYINGAEPNIDSMTWSINDLWTGAELLAPMFSQALFGPSPTNSSVQLVASESPYYTNVINNVQYKVMANAHLVTLGGGAMTFGKAVTPGYSYSNQGLYRRYAYICVGSNDSGTGCPATGSEVLIAAGQVCIPSGHSGEILFSAKTRIQGDTADGGGTLLLKIKINGNTVGQTGVQDIGPQPDAVSTRTISASYLSAGVNRLPPGCHTAQAFGQAIGDFRNVSMNADMPLIWFD